MSVRRLDPKQPEGFALSAQNLAWAKELIAKYPEGKQRSAVIPLLWRVQEQNEGWVSEVSMRTVADMLDMAYIRVYEIATFYTMFQLSPVGKKAHIQVCGTTPCMLRGSDALIEICRKKIAHKPHDLSDDGNFSWEEVECLGACVNAPMVQIFKDTYEDLTPEAFEDLIECFERGQAPKAGPQIDRVSSAPQSGITSLTTLGDVVNRDSGIKSQTQANAGGQKTSLSTKEEGVKPKATGTLKKTKKAAAKPLGTVSDVQAGDKPEGLTQAQGKADDLKQIKGVGPKIEGILNELGVFHFEQIAKWTPKNISWVDDHISFSGRIDREQWVKQAETLAKGGETEFSKRVAKGKVPSSKSDV